MGGRGKVGGVRFVANTIDAIAAAQMIFGLPILGEYPEVVLAEAKYNATREFYLSVILDRSVRRPVLLGSQQGGMAVESALQEIQHVTVDQEFSPFYARRLAVQMGLQGVLIQTVSAIIEKMYRLFMRKDLDCVEINPLGISANGDVMALDGKVTVNENALDRHPDLAEMVSKITNRVTNKQIKAKLEAARRITTPDSPLLVELEGNIGIICNGAGLTMATLDLVSQAGGHPACYLNLGGETHHYFPSTTQESGDVLDEDADSFAYGHLERGLKWIRQLPDIQVILINIFGSFLSCDRVATIIQTHLQRQPIRSDQALSFVIRFVGDEAEPARQRLADSPVILVKSLDDAVAQAVAAAQITEQAELQDVPL
jgi:succinyl-CoA synthetase beta subunit